MSQTRVTDARDAYWAFDPFAVVKPDDPWYEDLSKHLEAPRYGLGARLRNHLRPAPNAPDFVQMAVLGQSGVGKTTQVRGAIAEMPPEQVFPVMVDALTEFDPADLDFADLLFTIARSVLGALKEAGIDVPSDAAELLEAYFADETFVDSAAVGTSVELRSQAKAGVEVPFVASIMARFRASVKADSEYRREVRKVVQREPAELIRRVNFLLDEATKAVREHRGSDCRLLVVVDNLEKFEKREIVERAVITRAAELRGLRCHLVMFLHPADQYAPRVLSASAAFQKVVALPSLPLRKRTDAFDHVDPGCVRAVRHLLDRRVDVETVFDDPEAVVTALLKHSGGHLRDILAIAREACELYSAPQISVDHVDAAARSLSRIHNAKIRPDDWPRLREIARTKDIANASVDGYLLLHLIVLEYNGEAWWDLHPFVRMDRRFPEGSAVG